VFASRIYEAGSVIAPVSRLSLNTAAMVWRLGVYI
jgi:hypothetical protein